MKIVKEGILLEPVAIVDREQVWEEASNILDRVRAKLPVNKKSPRGQEEEIAQRVKDFRKRHASSL